MESLGCATTGLVKLDGSFLCDEATADFDLRIVRLPLSLPYTFRILLFVLAGNKSWEPGEVECPNVVLDPKGMKCNPVS